jgi:uncharacterized protein (DUF433 family)
MIVMDWPTLEPNPYIEILGPGDVRVRGTRINLCLVVEEYLEGQMPEQMVLSYPSLTLESIHGVLAYYLGQREAVDRYVQLWREKVEERERREAVLPEPAVVTRLKAIRSGSKAA